MEITTLSFENMHNHGELFANLFRARRESFIVGNKWDLPQALGMEYDQYDTPASRWLAVHEFGQVLAGIRLTPTTARCGIYSYMIRDAQRGLLDTIPQDLLYDEAPVADHIWETSRIFVARNTPHRQRYEVHNRLLGETMSAAREHGATWLLGLVPSIWPRWLTPHGVKGTAAGRMMTIDGARNQCVWFDLTSNLH